MNWKFFGMWLNSRIKYNPEKPPKGWSFWSQAKADAKWKSISEQERQKEFGKYIREQVIMDSVMFYLLCFAGILAVYNVWTWLML